MKMKIKPEHFRSLCEQLDLALEKRGFNIFSLEAHYTRENYPEANNLQTRRLWDCYWLIPLNWRTKWNDQIRAYGCDDTHLSTALKAWQRKCREE